jgi:hypothetical protein
MLIIEAGQGAPNAQSYVSAADCSAYHAARGNSLFGAMTEAEQEQAIIRAMDFLALYGPKWKGARVTDTQALDWPRYDVRIEGGGYGRCATYAPTDTVPAAVVKALCEMALRAGAGELVKDAEREVVEETIGPITTKWAAGGPAPQAQFTSVDLMLKPLMQSSSGVRLVRA